MRVSSEDDTAPLLNTHDVYLNDELLPVQSIIEANEEAHYAVLYRLDALGNRAYRALDGSRPGSCVIRYQTHVRYGTVRIEKRK